jgi:hypothetical protein
MRPRDKKIAIFEGKKLIFFSAVFFILFSVIKILDPDWIRIRIGIQPKILDPESMNPDPKHYL